MLAYSETPNLKTFGLDFFLCFQPCAFLFYKSIVISFSSLQIPFFSYCPWDLQRHITHHAGNFCFTSLNMPPFSFTNTPMTDDSAKRATKVLSVFFLRIAWACFVPLWQQSCTLCLSGGPILNHCQFQTSQRERARYWHFYRFQGKRCLQKALRDSHSEEKLKCGIQTQPQ